MPPKKISLIWDHFNLDKVNKTAICKADPAHVLPYSGPTSNLWNHLKFKHGLEKDEGRKDTSVTSYFQPKSSSAARFKKYNRDSPEQAEITDKLVTFIAKNYEPFSLIENEHFRALIVALNPSYIIPSAKSLKQKMEKKYEESLGDVKSFLHNASNNVCALTTDIWTSDAQAVSYMSLTASIITDKWGMVSKCLEVKPCSGSHTAENLIHHLRATTDEWDIPIQTVAIVRDSGANIKKATSEMEFPLDLSCFDHILQCAILKALSDETATTILKEARKILTHFHHSPLQVANLQAEATKQDISYRKLKQECPTRWGSTFEMLETLIIMKSPVRIVLMDSKTNETRDLVPSAEFWHAASLLCAPLEKLHAISKQLSSELSVSSSSIYAIVMNLLTYVMKAQHADESFIQNFKKLVCEYIEKRLDDDNILQVLQVSAVLGPRMKDLPFLTEEHRRKAYKLVRTELDSILEHTANDRDDSNDVTITTEPSNQEKAKRLETLFGSSSFDCYGTRPKVAKTQAQAITGKKALEAYLNEEAIGVDENPLVWWKEHENKHPYVAQLAKAYLGIPATSVSSERAFSRDGLIVTDKRSSLKPQSVRMLHFLNQNI